MTTKCGGCGADIFFARNMNGNRQPLDLEPNPDGNVDLVWIGGEQYAVTLNNADRAAAQIDGHKLYMPHHATCPQAARFRRRKKVDV